MIKPAFDKGIIRAIKMTKRLSAAADDYTGASQHGVLPLEFYPC